MSIVDKPKIEEHTGGSKVGWCNGKASLYCETIKMLGNAIQIFTHTHAMRYCDKICDKMLLYAMCSAIVGSRTKKKYETKFAKYSKQTDEEP